MTTKPGQHDLTIYQGATLNEQFQFFQANGTTPLNLTGLTVRMQARETLESASPYIDLNTGNGGITLTDDVNGKLTVNMTPEQTAALTIVNGFYDMELVNGGDVRRVLFGSVRLSRQVTK